MYSGDDASGLPTGAAIRNWGPTDRVYILFERVTEDDNQSDALLHEYACSDGDDCATASIVTLRGVGDALSPLPNLLQPSLGVHLKVVEGPDPVELVMALRQKLVADCDGDNAMNDADESFNLDQYAARWTSNNLGVEQTVVIYQYDSDSGAGVRMRVVVAERCGTGSWTPSIVRTPPQVEVDRDQAVEVGYPGIVLNRDEQIAHVAFVDLDDFRGDAQFDVAADGKLWWYRKGYDQCN